MDERSADSNVRESTLLVSPAPDELHIAGIDPDTRTITVVVVSARNSSICYSARIEAKGRTAEDRFSTLVEQFRKFVSRILRWDSSLGWLYIERPVLGVNVKALHDQALVVGAIRAILLEYRIPHSLIDSGTWKKATIGNGRATKQEIKDWAQRVINGAAQERKAPQDFYDACCIAAFGCRTRG